MSPYFRLSLFLILGLFAAVPGRGQSKADYRAWIEHIAQEGEKNLPAVLETWRKNVDPYVLWGYNPPGEPLYLADILAFLYTETGDESYARRAGTILADYGDLRDAYPADFKNSRIEYANGLPALANFFYLPPYSRAYWRIRNAGVLDDAVRRKIETTLAHSLDFVFHFPEWGAHNRAMLRAEGLYYGSLAIPDHPHAGRWRQMAETIASDNLTGWEIEDATIYHPIWLQALMSYADITGRDDLLDSPILRYYAEYFKQLFTPLATIPDYGDANWDPTWYAYLPVFERFAARYDDPELKWIAGALFERVRKAYPNPGAGVGSSLVEAYRWMDDTPAPERPTSGSREVLEDVYGKKIVFRSGWEPTSTYLLLNYQDEGPGGFAHREFLRNTLSVEEEKMHHGHSDENSLVLLIDGGSVLLHDGGYRSGLPSGPYGAYRADYFHNRLVARRDKRDQGQDIRSFLRTSGAYRPVTTRKVDFLTFDDVEMSRTRLEDDPLGYAWDRIVTYVQPGNFFIVVDAVRIHETDYYTFTNLWHTRRIHRQGPGFYDTSIDSIGTAAVPQHKRLLIRFLHDGARTDGAFAEDRHFMPEQAIYQTKSSHYRAGDREVFVTLLVPHDASSPIEPLLDRVRLLEGELPRAIGFEITDGSDTSYLGLKLDLESEIISENIRPRYTWEAGRTSYGPFETDAHFLYATPAQDSLRYAASQVLKVLYRGRPLMEALPNTHTLQTDGGPDRVGYVKWRYWEDTVPLD